MTRHKLESLNDALIYLCQRVVANNLTRTMGDNCLIVGDMDNYARVSLVSPVVAEAWTTLLIEIFKNEVKVTSYKYYFAGMKCAPNDKSEFSNPDLDQGGYVWTSGRGVEWYNFRPSNIHTDGEVHRICEFHDCLKPTSRPLVTMERFR